MVVIVFTVGAAVKPAANSLPENTKEPEPTPPTTEAVQQEPYPFNLIAKLVKIKALAERGIGGEQQTAQVMYTTLKEKYKVTDAEIEKAAEVPVDISEIDLKKFWGIAFQLATVAKTLQEETDICTACPYTYTDEQCTGCGTYWNMRDLRLDFEAIQQRLIKAATEG